MSRHSSISFNQLSLELSARRRSPRCLTASTGSPTGARAPRCAPRLSSRRRRPPRWGGRGSARALASRLGWCSEREGHSRSAARGATLGPFPGWSACHAALPSSLIDAAPAPPRCPALPLSWTLGRHHSHPRAQAGGCHLRSRLHTGSPHPSGAGPRRSAAARPGHCCGLPRPGGRAMAGHAAAAGGVSGGGRWRAAVPARRRGAGPALPWQLLAVSRAGWEGAILQRGVLWPFPCVLGSSESFTGLLVSQGIQGIQGMRATISSTLLAFMSNLVKMSYAVSAKRAKYKYAKENSGHANSRPPRLPRSCCRSLLPEAAPASPPCWRLTAPCSPC